MCQKYMHTYYLCAATKKCVGLDPYRRKDKPPAAWNNCGRPGCTYRRVVYAEVCYLPIYCFQCHRLREEETMRLLSGEWRARMAELERYLYGGGRRTGDWEMEWVESCGATFKARCERKLQELRVRGLAGEELYYSGKMDVELEAIMEGQWSRVLQGVR